MNDNISDEKAAQLLALYNEQARLSVHGEVQMHLTMIDLTPGLSERDRQFFRWRVTRALISCLELYPMGSEECAECLALQDGAEDLLEDAWGNNDAEGYRYCIGGGYTTTSNYGYIPLAEEFEIKSALCTCPPVCADDCSCRMTFEWCTNRPTPTCRWQDWALCQWVCGGRVGWCDNIWCPACHISPELHCGCTGTHGWSCDQTSEGGCNGRHYFPEGVHTCPRELCEGRQFHLLRRAITVYSRDAHERFGPLPVPNLRPIEAAPRVEMGTALVMKQIKANEAPAVQR